VSVREVVARAAGIGRKEAASVLVVALRQRLPGADSVEESTLELADAAAGC